MPKRIFDFPQSVKRTLAARVGYRCSNPNCKNGTSCGHTDQGKALNLGDAAHIFNLKGDRFNNSEFEGYDLKGIENGIWLCGVCHKKIDRDEKRYSSKLLLGWKLQAEALAELETRGINGFKNSNIEPILYIRDFSIKMPKFFCSKGGPQKNLISQYFLQIKFENVGSTIISRILCSISLNKSGKFQEYTFSNKFREKIKFKSSLASEEGYIEFYQFRELFIGQSLVLGQIKIPKECIHSDAEIDLKVCFDDNAKIFSFYFNELDLVFG